ncbi:hypothetical protein ACLOJK_007544 [Asimina triloba]
MWLWGQLERWVLEILEKSISFTDGSVVLAVWDCLILLERIPEVDLAGEEEAELVFEGNGGEDGQFFGWKGGFLWRIDGLKGMAEEETGSFLDGKAVFYGGLMVLKGWQD